MPSNYELQEYIHNYKSGALKDQDRQKNRAFAWANEIGSRLVSQLMLIASAMLTIIGGFVVSQNVLEDNGVKVVLTLSIVFLLLSICAGFMEYYNTVRFFEKWGKHHHQQGAIIVRDNSTTFRGLEALRNKLQEKADIMPDRSSDLFIILQVIAFLVGVILLLILIIVKIFS